MNKERLTVAGVCLLLLAIGGVIGFFLGINVPRSLGGIDVQAACSHQFAGSKAVVANNNVYGWVCVSQDGAVHGVNLNKQCAVQYGNGASATYSDFKNPYSWTCRR